MARPRKEIDQRQFETLCAMMCTLEEIAGVMGCSGDTIERWCKRTYNQGFAETYKNFSAKGKMTLRRYQLELAKKSAAMAIFLGKNYLGQKDNVEYEDKESLARLDAILQGMMNNAAKPETE